MLKCIKADFPKYYIIIILLLISCVPQEGSEDFIVSKLIHENRSKFDLSIGNKLVKIKSNEYFTPTNSNYIKYTVFNKTDKYFGGLTFIYIRQYNNGWIYLLKNNIYSLFQDESTNEINFDGINELLKHENIQIIKNSILDYISDIENNFYQRKILYTIADFENAQSEYSQKRSKMSLPFDTEQTVKKNNEIVDNPFFDTNQELYNKQKPFSKSDEANIRAPEIICYENKYFITYFSCMEYSPYQVYENNIEISPNGSIKIIKVKKYQN